MLGRSRQLQGLAAAMVKLWERSSIAKIALKRGVQLTTSERMAEDIKVNIDSFIKNIYQFLYSILMESPFSLVRNVFIGTGKTKVHIFCANETLLDLFSQILHSFCAP